MLLQHLLHPGKRSTHLLFLRLEAGPQLHHIWLAPAPKHAPAWSTLHTPAPRAQLLTASTPTPDSLLRRTTPPPLWRATLLPALHGRARPWRSTGGAPSRWVLPCWQGGCCPAPCSCVSGWVLLSSARPSVLGCRARLRPGLGAATQAPLPPWPYNRTSILPRPLCCDPSRR